MGPLEQHGMPLVVRDLAAEMLPGVPRLAREMTDHLFANMPELVGSRDDDLYAETLASVQANVDQALRLLRLGADVDAIVLPVEAVEYTRALVHRGIALPLLLRMYRLGHRWFWDHWSRTLRRHISDPDELHAAQEQLSAFTFAYVDRTSDVLVTEYAAERERSMRGAAQLRAETVRAILAGEPLDAEVATGRLGYALRRHHVALRVSSCASEVRGLERAATEAATALGTSEPLVIPSGGAMLDVWCGAFAALDTTRLDAYTPHEGIRVAVGTCSDGVAGFRRSHDEAVQASRIATLAAGGANRVTRYSSVELVALLTADLPRARAFVARQLGPLAANTEAIARLRDTALAFLSAGASTARVAEKLYLHQNTVGYRIKRAEELLGRRMTEDAVELGCALRLAATLGPAVLSERPVDDAG